MKGENNPVLSAANLSKIKSANVNEYGGMSSKGKTGLQSYQLEKRISTSASTKSKVRLHKNRCFYLNKTEFFNTILTTHPCNSTLAFIFGKALIGPLWHNISFFHSSPYS